MSGNCCLPSRRLAHGTTLAINLLDCGSAMPWKCHGSKVGGWNGEQIRIQARSGFSHLSFCHECPRIPPRTCSDSATYLQARMDSIRELLRADSSTNLPAQIWSDSRTNTVGFSHTSSSANGQSSGTFVSRFKHKSSSTNVWGFENEYLRIQPLVSRRLLVIFKIPPKALHAIILLNSKASSYIEFFSRS